MYVLYFEPANFVIVNCIYNTVNFLTKRKKNTNLEQKSINKYYYDFTYLASVS